MDSSDVFLISISICISSLYFAYQVRKDLFENPEDSADQIKEDAKESDWTMLRIFNWIALASGLISVAEVLTAVFMLLLTIFL